MTSSEIDFDGDEVEISVRGKKATMFACDEVDAIFAAIKAADAANPLPDVLNEETGLMEPGTHGKGESFVAMLVSHFKENHGLEVRPNVAYAIWNALTRKADEYRDFFENGRSSQPPLGSPLKESSADAKLNERLSTMQDNSGPQNA